MGGPGRKRGTRLQRITWSGRPSTSFSCDLVLSSLCAVRALRRLGPRYADDGTPSMGRAVRTNRPEEHAAGDPPPASPDKEQIRLADGSYQCRPNWRGGECYADRHVCRDASEEFDQRVLDDTHAGTPASGTLIGGADRRRTVEG